MSELRVPIIELVDGQSLEQAFRVADKQLRVNRQGGKYILLKLADRSGIIAAMMWNADERIFDSFDRGDFLHCSGRTQVHNGQLQVIASKIERMDPNEVEISDYEQFDQSKSSQLLERLRELLLSVNQEHLRLLGEAFLGDEKFVNAFQRAPAAVSHHHAYPGGLLQHTLDLMELAKLVAPRYPQVDQGLLIFGAFLHDLGKIDEMSGGGEASYTDRGQLVGHIVIGVQLLDEKIRQVKVQSEVEFCKELQHHLEHLIVSHHGQLEYGSPRLPVTMEAVVLHHLDNLDAKVASYTSVIESDISADGNWTNYNPSIGRKLWKK
ncbi:OB-fold nucleic acid binding domain-containing protein [Rubripirellula sp.]|nr:OB-fold nucleic acid binding domain-containing protein [Rubripirellula sp.]MDB4338556.1 OB-fold nucleic acid binding domain-containing protein [Rubripirellula sp.]